MTDKLDRRTLSKLAKIDTAGMKHTQKLDAFAKALGYESQTALMGQLKKEEAAEKDASLEGKVNSKMSRLADSLTAMAGGLKDALPGDPVWATMHSDDYVVEVTVDARPYLMSVSAEDYAALRDEDFGSGYASDEVFYALEDKDPDAKRLSDYLSFSPTTITGDTVGFSVNVDGDAAEEWVARHRPEIAGEPVYAEFVGADGETVGEEDIRPFLAAASGPALDFILDGRGESHELLSYAWKNFPLVKEAFTKRDQLAQDALEAGRDPVEVKVSVKISDDALAAARQWAALCRGREQWSPEP